MKMNHILNQYFEFLNEKPHFWSILGTCCWGWGGGDCPPYNRENGRGWCWWQHQTPNWPKNQVPFLWQDALSASLYKTSPSCLLRRTHPHMWTVWQEGFCHPSHAAGSHKSATHQGETFCLQHLRESISCYKSPGTSQNEKAQCQLQGRTSAKSHLPLCSMWKSFDNKAKTAGTCQSCSSGHQRLFLPSMPQRLQLKI